jgi:hypothetical protein
VVLLGAVLLAVVTTWPLVLHLRTDIAAETVDPLLQAWQVAWDGHALLHQPLDWFQANTFFPLGNSLAFSDALIGYTPAGLIGSGPQAALVRYDLLFIFSYGLAFAGAYVLARELGLSRAGSIVAGAAFAYAPFRVTQWPHLHVLSSGGIPLSLGLLLRGYRSTRPAWILAGWAVATWQLSLGFTLGLMLVYLLAGLAVVIGFRVRRLPPRPVLLASAGGATLFVAAAVLLALPYFAVLHGHPEARRALADVHALSPPPIGLLSASAHDAVWGGATSAVRDTLDWPTEQSLWPGLVILVLALAGWRAAQLSRPVRRGLVIGIAVTLVLAFGLRLFGDWSPYRLLYEFAPGWNGVRTPGRIFTLTTLGFALLAGAGAAELTRRLGERRLAVALPWVLALAIVAEGWGSLPHLRPATPVAANVPEPRLYLPSADEVDSQYMYWSTDGFPRIVNGLSGFRPRLLDATRAVMARFPDRESVRLLQVLGVRSVVLTDFASASAAAEVERRPTAGLPLTVHHDGPAIWYEVAPAR